MAGSEIPVAKRDQAIVPADQPQPVADPTSRRLYEAVNPGLVQVDFGQGFGSGFLLDNKGHVVTDAHVAGAGYELFVIDAAGKRFSAKIEKADVVHDLAILTVDGLKDRAPLSLGDSTKLKPEDALYAFGYPLGYRPAYVAPGVLARQTTQNEAILGLEKPALKTFGAFGDTLGQLQEKGLPQDRIIPVPQDRTIPVPQDRGVPQYRSIPPDGDVSNDPGRAPQSRRFPDAQDGSTLTSEHQALISEFQNRRILQAKLHVEPGNSGGPLTDVSGKVVGIADYINSKNASDSFFTPVESLKDIAAKPSAFDFKYSDRHEGLLVNYAHSWQRDPLATGLTTGILGGVGYLGYKGLSRFPVGMGVASTILGGSHLYSDFHKFQSSGDLQDKVANGLAIAADGATIAGGVMQFMPQYRIAGQLITAGGILGRIGTDSIPVHHVVLDAKPVHAVAGADASPPPQTRKEPGGADVPFDRRSKSPLHRWRMPAQIEPPNGSSPSDGLPQSPQSGQGDLPKNDNPYSKYYK